MLAKQPVVKLFGSMVLLAGSFFIAITALAEPPLSLSQAVAYAQQYDLWLVGSRYREQAIAAQSVAAEQLPGPKLSAGFINLPVDSFDFSQEPMTQFRLGVVQDFPRGNSLKLKGQQLRQIGGQQPYLRQDRRAKVAVEVSQLWLEVYRNDESVRLIERDRALFEYLVDVAESSYTSAVGKTRQQDLIRAQLELLRLEDRLSVLHQHRETNQSKLAEWFPDTARESFVSINQLPSIALARAVIDSNGNLAQQQLIADLLEHPSIKSLEQQISASGTSIALARQKYKPQWGLNASYGYRDDDAFGDERSDFFSLGVTFDLPIFTAQRQDKQVQAALATTQAMKVDKALALRSMQARFETAVVRLQRLNQRKTLYEKRLLNETHNQAEASLNAYTNDDGDFSEVVRARIAELNANIESLNINIDRLKTIVELNYFLLTPQTNTDVVLSHE